MACVNAIDSEHSRRSRQETAGTAICRGLCHSPLNHPNRPSICPVGRARQVWDPGASMVPYLSRSTRRVRHVYMRHRGTSSVGHRTELRKSIPRPDCRPHKSMLSVSSQRAYRLRQKRQITHLVGENSSLREQNSLLHTQVSELQDQLLRLLVFQ